NNATGVADYVLTVNTWDGRKVSEVAGQVRMGSEGNAAVLSYQRLEDRAGIVRIGALPPNTGAARIEYKLAGATAWQTTDAIASCTEPGVFLWDSLGLPQGDYDYRISAVGTLSVTEGQIRFGGDYPGRLSGALTAGSAYGPANATASHWKLSGLGSNLVTHDRVRYDAFGAAVEQTDALGNSRLTYYDGAGRVRQELGPVVSSFDEAGMEHIGRKVVHYGWSAGGRLRQRTDENGHSTAYSYISAVDAKTGQPLVYEQRDAAGSYRTSRYNSFGDMVHGTDEGGITTVNTWNAFGELQSVSRNAFNVPGTHYQRFWYDEAGRRIGASMANSDTLRSSTIYDAQNRVIQTVSAEGICHFYDYGYSNGVEVLTVSTGDSAHQISMQLRRDSLDYFGRKIDSLDAGGHLTSYAYNASGWLQQQTSTAGQDLRYEYFASGQTARITDAALGRQITYGYDALGNRIEARTTTWSASSPQRRALDSTATAYDALHRVISMRSAEASVQYKYDAAGNVRNIYAQYRQLSFAGPSVPENDWYKYDAMNRVTVSKGQRSGGTVVAGDRGIAMQYNGLGQRTQVDYGKNAAENTYRTTEIEWRGNLPWPIEVAHVYREVYGYDINGEIARIDLSTPHNGGVLGYSQRTVTYGINGYKSVTQVENQGQQGQRIVQSTFNRDERLAGKTVTQVYRKFENNQWRDAGDVTKVSDYDYAPLGGALLFQSETETHRAFQFKEGRGWGWDWTKTLENDSEYQVEWWGESAQQTGSHNTTHLTLANANGSAQPRRLIDNGFGDVEFDQNGNVKAALQLGQSFTYENQAKMTSDTWSRTVFATDHEGTVMEEHEVHRYSPAGDNNTPFQINHRYTKNLTMGGRTWGSLTNTGMPQGSYRIDNTIAPVTSDEDAPPPPPWRAEQVADFDQNFVSVMATGAVGGSVYTVRAGDTLKSIAASRWGDEGLWYLLADANGLAPNGEPNGELTAGQTLRVPNHQGGTAHHSGFTSRPQVASQSNNIGLGDFAPAPTSRQCNVTTIVALSAISIVAGLATGGAAMAIMGPVMAGTLLGAVIAGAAAGFGASAAAEAYKLITADKSDPNRPKFGWSTVAAVAVGTLAGAAGAVVGAGVASLSSVLGEVTNSAAKIALNAARSVVTSVATSLLNPLIERGVNAIVPGKQEGEDKPLSYSWVGILKGAAVSAAGSVHPLLGSAVSFATSLQPGQPWIETFAQTAMDAAGGYLQGVMDEHYARHTRFDAGDNWNDFGEQDGSGGERLYRERSNESRLDDHYFENPHYRPSIAASPSTMAARGPGAPVNPLAPRIVGRDDAAIAEFAQAMRGD
ncbi:MAG TPA: LysM peptidoglycan-binding domain-containing protein, partial [Burkholderiaceae bacterium]